MVLGSMSGLHSENAARWVASAAGLIDSRIGDRDAVGVIGRIWGAARSGQSGSSLWSGKWAKGSGWMPWSRRGARLLRVSNTELTAMRLTPCSGPTLAYSMLAYLLVWWAPTATARGFRRSFLPQICGVVLTY